MKVKCAICGRDRDESTCTIFETTKEERRYLAASGAAPQERLAYCRPCMRIMSDPTTALQLMKGVVQVHASALGAVNAEELAERFKNRLLAKSKIPTK